MRTTGWLALAAGLGLLGSAHPAEATSKIAWATSLSAAMAQAKASGKLAMVDFYADW
jgi:thiol:disulfide interchange protein